MHFLPRQLRNERKKDRQLRCVLNVKRREKRLCFVLPCRNNRATSLMTSHIEFDRVHQNKGRGKKGLSFLCKIKLELETLVQHQSSNSYQNRLRSQNGCTTPPPTMAIWHNYVRERPLMMSEFQGAFLTPTPSPHSVRFQPSNGRIFLGHFRPSSPQNQTLFMNVPLNCAPQLAMQQK